jgi:phosphoribosyl 1,2-cyclic phosphate phosphodiesterase
MRVIVLGCGGSAGVPLIGGPDGRGDWGVCDPAEPRNRRSRPAIVVAAGGTQLLVDTGPDLRSQLLSCGINRIDAVLYTHAHADHVSGIDDVRILNRIVGRPLEAWGLPHTLAELSERFRYAFQISENQNFFYKPALIARPLDPPARTRIGALEVHPFRQNHGFSETLGFRIGPFAYSTDVVELDDTARAILKGVDTWLVDCFQRAPHKTHAHLDKVLRWAEELGVRRTVLTHMGTDMDWGWLCDHLPAGVEPAYDGMTIALET